MFGKKKIAKSQKPDTAPYTLYNPHHKDLNSRKWNPDYLRICSIDPAPDNCAVRVETRPKHAGVQDFITCQLFTKVGFREEVSTEGYNLIYQTITNFFDSHLALLKTCHLIVMERQQVPENYRSTRIGQHILSYILFRLSDAPLLPIIMELDPKLKGKRLGAPPLNYNGLKKWSTEKATELLTRRQDEYSLGILTTFKTKKDDLSDTVCQIEALFDYFGWPLTSDPPEIPKIQLPQTKKLVINKAK